MGACVPVLRPPKDTTPLACLGVKFAQFVHLMHVHKCPVATLDFTDYAWLSCLAPNKHDMLQTLEHRNERRRAFNYDYWRKIKTTNRYLCVAERLLEQPTINPERLALVQLIVQSMLGPHCTMDEAQQLLRRRMLYLHPDRSDAALARTKLTSPSLWLDRDFDPHGGRDELMLLMLSVKQLIAPEPYGRLLYQTDWENYGALRARDVVVPIAAWVGTVAAGSVIQGMAAAVGCLCGLRVVLGAIAMLCAYLTFNADKLTNRLPFSAG